MGYPDYGLTFEKLREQNVKRCEAAFHPLDSWSPNDWGVAAGGELGEAQNKLKKMRRGDQPPFNTTWPELVGEELADTVIYIDLLCARLGIDLAGAIRGKFNAVSEERDCRIRL